MPARRASDVPGGAAGRVCVVDDDAHARKLLSTVLSHAGHQVAEFASGPEAIAGIDDTATAVCLDLGLGAGDLGGIEVMKHLHSRLPELPIVVVTAARDVETAVQAMRAGAYDYILKPIEPERLVHSVERAVERHALAAEVSRLSRELGRTRAQGLVGESGPMRELSRQIARVVDSDVAVCILGESGTGKELIARHIHDAGERAARSFVAINCASIPQTLQESELFGHERGAFTGAVGIHRGRFEQATGGTLFLDEVGEMSAATQATLLRTLQDKTIRRVGGTSEIPVDVRIISATHRDLEAEIEAGRFRRDLYFRLVVFPVHVPALREREGDMPRLVAHFIAKHQSEKRPVKRVSPDALEALASHRFPGNVRELENVIQRAILSCDGDEIQLAHLPPALRQLALPPLPQPRATPIATEAAAPRTIITLEELEKRAITDAMAQVSGNVGAAARLLGIGRTTLYRRLGVLGISIDPE